MTNETAEQLFRQYFNYWVVELKLNEQYRFRLTRDNRLGYDAFVETSKKPYEYLVKFNVKEIKAKYKILAVVLHEIGHLISDFRYGSEADQEEFAELFALKKIKEHYPKFYRRCVNWTKQAIKKPDQNEAHRIGYTNALRHLGEL